jgi:hypothetical protein
MEETPDSIVLILGIILIMHAHPENQQLTRLPHDDAQERGIQDNER